MLAILRMTPVWAAPYGLVFQTALRMLHAHACHARVPSLSPSIYPASVPPQVQHQIAACLPFACYPRYDFSLVMLPKAMAACTTSAGTTPLEPRAHASVLLECLRTVGALQVLLLLHVCAGVGQVAASPAHSPSPP